MSLLSRSSVPAGAVAAAPPPATGGAGGGRAPLRSPLALGALAAVQAVVGSLLTVVAPVVAVWIAATDTGATWVEAVRVAADAWLLAHHTGIAVTGGQLAVVPLGLTLVVGGWSWAAGRRLAIALGLSAATSGTPPADPVTGGPARAARRAVVTYAAAYGLLAAVVSLLAASPVARPLSGQALAGGAVLAGLVSGAAVLHTWRTAGRSRPWSVVADRLRVPAALRRVLPAALLATAGWVGAGALLLAAALAVHGGDVTAAHRALDPGVLGGAGLVAAQLLLLPTLVVWAAAWLAGPGFVVGEGTVVSPAVVELGPVPALPVLGALPDPLGTAGWAVLVGPVLLGVLAGRRLLRDRGGVPGGWAAAGRDVALTGLVTGGLAAVLAWVASGPAGPGRLAEVGPQGWAVGAAVGVEVAVGCAVALGVAALRAR